MRQKKSIMVLGKGPVLVMTVLFLLLMVFLAYMFLQLRSREAGLGFACLFFALASGAAAVLLLLAYFAHRKDDERLTAHWAELEKDPTLADPEPNRERRSEDDGTQLSQFIR